MPFSRLRGHPSGVAFISRVILVGVSCNCAVFLSSDGDAIAACPISTQCVPYQDYPIVEFLSPKKTDQFRKGGVVRLRDLISYSPSPNPNVTGAVAYFETYPGSGYRIVASTPQYDNGVGGIETVLSFQPSIFDFQYQNTYGMGPAPWASASIEFTETPTGPIVISGYIQTDISQLYPCYPNPLDPTGTQGYYYIDGYHLAPCSLGSTPTGRNVGPNFSFGGGISAQKIVVIDAGHGKFLQNGVLDYQRPATVPHDLHEDDLTLAMANSATDYLQTKFKVLKTRPGVTADHAPADCPLKNAKGKPTGCKADIEWRRKFAEGKGADVIVSIHTNANDDLFTHGVETYWKYKQNQSVDLSTRLYSAVLPYVAPFNTSKHKVEQGPWGVLSQNASSSLVEVAFHTNSELQRGSGQTVTDLDRLNQPLFLSSVGRAIGTAVEEFLEVYPR